MRVIDEQLEDVQFRIIGLEPGSLTSLHQKYLDIFYEEEFDHPEDPLGCDQNRSMIPRQKIQSAISTANDNILNPSDALAIRRTIFRSISGYVHGASEHISEMVVMDTGQRPKYLLTGMLGSERENSFIRDTWHRMYAGILVSALIAKSLNNLPLYDSLTTYKVEFEERSGETNWTDPKSSVQQYKRIRRLRN